MVKKNFLKSSLIVLVALAMVLPVIPTISLAVAPAVEKPSITYSAHMQTYGWDKTNQKPGDALGEAKVFAGVTGQSKRMEALEVNMAKMDGVTLEYRAHVQGIGWMDWVTADSVADHKATVGTTGKSLRVEALQLSVKGLSTKGCSILYRAHVQGEGWMDWVDAEDPTAFAGTEGRSLRMEAFEIVIVPENEFYYVNNRNGTHTVSYNGKLGATEDCVYGDYTVASGKFTKSCALCGYSNNEKKSLQGVLTDAQLDGQSKVSLGTVNLATETETLKIPEGMTLEVADALTLGTHGVKVEGHLVVKTISDLSTNKNQLTFGDNGKLTFSGVYSEATSNSILNTVLADGNETILKHTDKIVLEEGSGAQTLTATAKVPADTELVLDLNGTKVNGVDGQYMIESSGDLTINDVNFASATGKGVIVKDGPLTINGGKMATQGWAVAVVGSDMNNAQSNDLSDMPVVIKNVEVTTTGNPGVGTFGNNGEVTLESVTIKNDTEGAYGLTSNGRTTGAKFNVKNSTIINNKCIAVYIPGQGEYNFDNCTITGTEGIECTRGTVTLNNTAVTATGKPAQSFDLELSAGNGTFEGSVDNGGHNSFGGAVQIKMETNLYVPEDTKAVLEMKGNSTLTSHYGPALLVFGTDDPESSLVVPHYTTSAVSGYTKNSTKEGASAVVWAHKNS